MFVDLSCKFTGLFLLLLVLMYFVSVCLVLMTRKNTEIGIDLFLLF